MTSFMLRLETCNTENWQNTLQSVEERQFLLSILFPWDMSTRKYVYSISLLITGICQYNILQSKTMLFGLLLAF